MTETQLVTFLGTAALKGAVILAIAGLVNASWRSASASTRHLVWTIGVGLALTLPLLSAGIQQLGAPRIEIAGWSPATDETFAPDETLAPAVTPLAQVAIGVDANDRVLPAMNVAAVTSGDSDLNLGNSDSNPVKPADNQDWSRDAFYLWLAGVVLSLLPLATSMARVRVLESRATVLDTSRWTSLIERTPAIAHLAGRVRVMESENTTMPMTWGIISPTLLVPSSSERWPEWQCRNILLHELAHVERRDCLTQFLAQLACAVYWFNPLAWVAAHRMRVERELACDDRVISAGSRASDYAANLLDVARSLRAPSYTSQSAIAMARPSQLSGRLLAVLDTNRNRRSVTRRVAVGVSLSSLVVALPLASLTPRAEAATLAEAPSTQPAPELTSSPEVSTRKSTAMPAFTTMATAIVRAAQLPAIGLVEPAIRNAPLTGPATTPALPVFATQDVACWAEGSGNTNISINDDDSRGRRPSWNVRYSRDGCSMELRAEGKFTLRADLSDLESLENDGWFRVEERVGRNSRRMEIRRAGNGSLEHLYWVNGDRVTYDNDGRAWLARTLLAVERRTAFAASTRVPQLYRSGGLRAVLSEISLMPSEYAKSKYYSSLLEMDIRLDANTLNNVVRQVSTDLASSDYYMSEVLGKFAKQPAANEGTWRTFAEAAGRMKSDYYKSETLKKVLKSGQLGSETVGILLKSASGIKSDYYVSELLKSVAGRYALNAQTSAYYADALRRIESDHYRGELLKAMGNDGTWDARTNAYVLTSIADMKSDYYKSEALARLIKDKHVDNWPVFFNATGSIDSDYYKRETLIASLRQQPLTREVVSGVLGVAAKMRSDNEIAEVLTFIARSYRIDDAIRPAFDKALDAIDSDYYRGSVLSAQRRSAAR